MFWFSRVGCRVNSLSLMMWGPGRARRRASTQPHRSQPFCLLRQRETQLLNILAQNMSFRCIEQPALLLGALGNSSSNRNRGDVCGQAPLRRLGVHAFGGFFAARFGYDSALEGTPACLARRGAFAGRNGDAGLPRSCESFDDFQPLGLRYLERLLLVILGGVRVAYVGGREGYAVLSA